MIREALVRLEVTVGRFGVSPWSSAALAVYGIAWITAEAMRGKWIGWDGFITLILGEIALASLRAIDSRKLEEES